MRPCDSAYDRDRGDFGWSVTHVEGHGWRLFGPDSNNITVVAEPGVYYGTPEEAEEALEIFRENL
jgi:hypothetical protein